MKREKFGSRLGFILVSAGCAIGIGNVWKFPYMCGEFGGAAFILIYLVFLLILGIPVMICEFAVGRGSRRSVAASFVSPVFADYPTAYAETFKTPTADAGMKIPPPIEETKYKDFRNDNRALSRKYS